MYSPVSMFKSSGFVTVPNARNTISQPHETSPILSTVMIWLYQVLGFCLPGGLGGSKNIANSTMCETLCKTCLENNGLVSAICAAPALALGKWGILKDKKFTCFPNMEEEVAPELRQGFLQDRVVIDGNLITARGAGVAEEFSFAIIEALCEKNAVNSLKEKIVAR